MDPQRGAITAALKAARLAPSAHNSQPARFRVDGTTVHLGWDPRRLLPAGDPHGHYLFAGLGASAESLLLGAAGVGCGAQVAVVAGPSPEEAARIDVSAEPPRPDDAELAGAVGDRQTTRLPFRPDPVTADRITAMAAEAEALGCRLAVVDGRGAMGRFAGLVAKGTARNFASADVYEEFFSWLRLRRTHPDHDRDGLSASALSLGRLTAAVAPLGMTPAAMRMFGHARLLGALAGTQRRLARAAPAACLLTAPSGDPAGRFTGGRAMLRVWGRASTMDLRVQPMTAAIDHAETRAGLAELFGVAADAPMVVCFRLGHGPAGPRSPRLPLSELLR